MKKRAAFVVSLFAAVLLLSGCGVHGRVAGQFACELSPGSVSSQTRVQHVSGEVPKISVPVGVKVLGPQMSFVHKSVERSRLLGVQKLAEVRVVEVDAESGEVLNASAGFKDSSAPSQLYFLDPHSEVRLQKGLSCLMPGDKVVMAAPVPVRDEAGKTDVRSVLSYIEVLNTFPVRADGVPQGLPNGYPGISVTDSGRPGIVLAPSEAAPDVGSAVNLLGSGKKISAESTPIVKVLTVNRETGSVLENTWQFEDVMSVKVLSPRNAAQQENDSLRPQLDGYRVGSQIVVYGSQGDVKTVSVVDILAG